MIAFRYSHYISLPILLWLSQVAPFPFDPGKMGSGASVLGGDPIGVECYSPAGYTFDFPPDHPIWREGHSSASCSTGLPSDTLSSEEDVEE